MSFAYEGPDALGGTTIKVPTVKDLKIKQTQASETTNKMAGKKPEDWPDVKHEGPVSMSKLLEKYPIRKRGETLEAVIDAVKK